MRRLLACLLATLCAAPPALAQSFIIDEASPSTGSAGVPLQTTVRFEFNDAVDQTTNLNLAFQIIPRDAVRINGVALIPDEPERECPSLPSDRTCPSVVEYTVTQQVGTDVTWLAYAVETPSGDGMTEPFVLRYTTASTIGEYSVAGEVWTAAPTAASPTTSTALNTMRRLTDYLEREGYGQPVFRADAPQHKNTASNAARGATHPHTLVLLLDEYTALEQAWDIQAATVISGETGAFRINYVRPGLYYPIAVRYTDATRREIEAVGYYDSDNDGTPDPVTTEDGSVTGVDLEMQSFQATTATDHLALARDSAANYADDQRLVGIRATSGARSSGAAYTWTYDFFAPSQSLRTTVNVDPLGASINTTTAPPPYASYPALPNAFVDSDAALAEVMASGDAEFIQRFESLPQENRSTIIQGGPVYVRPDDPSGDTFWKIQLYTFTSTQINSLEAVVNMTTGAVPIEAPDHAASATRLRPAFPHPVTHQATLPFDVETASEVTLEVFDVLGRHVATLVDGEWMTSGRHSVSWEPLDVSSGTYLVRLTAGAQAATRTLMLVRP